MQLPSLFPQISSGRRRVIPMSTRLAMRDSYGDPGSTYHAALDDFAHGDLLNAWAGLDVTLNSWLRHQFVELTGRANSPIHDSLKLLDKLRSGAVVDRWTVDVVKASMRRPEKLAWDHVDIKAAIVEAVCFGELTHHAAKMARPR